MKAGVLSFVAMILCGFVATAHARLIACVGDSITYGSGISDRLNDSYPAQLQRMLRQYDPAWEVQNFGARGATLLSRGDTPYIRESAYSGAKACNPDIVIIKLGTNAATGAIMTRLTDGSRITTPLVSSMIVTAGAWHCVRLVWDGSHRYLHVDDAEVASDKR